jgi:hypothetical protein
MRFPGKFNFYLFKHVDQTDRFDVFHYPTAHLEDCEAMDLEPSVLHSKSMSGNLVSENCEMFLKML